jgi:glycerol-3-phosphate acyltransferase PlsY
MEALPHYLTQSYIIVAIGGYLLGSIPFGLVLTRVAGMGDIRDIGSGNIGATNVLRSGNKVLAFLTLICDSSKGALAGLGAAYFMSIEAGLVAGFTAVLGHNFPIWLKFRGGKGVATSLGVLIVSSWMVGTAACATWLLMASLFRYSSLAALLALAAAPVYAWWFGRPDVSVMALGLTLLAILRHHENIGRLMRGSETKIGKNSSK